MVLQLALPPLSEQTPLDIDLGEAERWIANLPVLNAAESSHHLFTALTGLNRRTLDDRLRLQLLELYRRPIRIVCAEQQKRYIGLPVPLSHDNRLVAERVRQFQIELAYGYKRVVVGLSAQDRREPPPANLRALATQRAIRALTHILIRSHELYMSSPEGTWREIHLLYRHAEADGFVDMPVADELNTVPMNSSVGHAYKQALLFGFCDPNHLPAQLLQKVDQYLDVYAPLAQLSPGAATLQPECQFLVDPISDRAGPPVTEAVPAGTESQYRLLTTGDLVRTMHQQLTVLRNNGQMAPDPLGDSFYANRGSEILVHLITSWGVHPKRLFPRAPKSAIKAELVRGIGNIGLYVNQGVAFVHSTTEVGPQPIRGQISGHNPAPASRDAAGTQAHEIWDLLNESAGGFSLTATGSGEQRMQVGELLAVRIGEQKAGRGIAVTRWVRSTETGRIEFGAQRLAPTAAPIAVAVRDAPETRFQPALQLPEIAPLRQPQTLITSRGLFKPERVLILDDGYRTHQIRIVRLVNLTGSFEQFEFSWLD